MRPLCCGCRKEMKIIQNGIVVAVPVGEGKDTLQLWCADYYECSDCGCSVASGYGASPSYIDRNEFEAIKARATSHNLRVYEVE